MGIDREALRTNSPSPNCHGSHGDYKQNSGLIWHKYPFTTIFIVCNNMGALKGAQGTVKVVKVVRMLTL